MAENLERDIDRHQTPNAETIAAIEEVEQLKTNPDKKAYNSFAELLNDLDAD